MDDSAVRKIDLAYMKRARSLEPHMTGDHMESIAIALHQALDNWRFHDGPSEDVTLCVDAMVALWSVIEDRISV